MRKLTILTLSTILAGLSFVSVNAQGFPWGDFKSRTLKDIVNSDAKEIEDSMKRTSLIVHGDMLFSVVRVKYTGKNRQISSVKKELLQNWGKMFGQTDKYLANYETDYLFTESGVEYWLPVQKKVSAYFPKELKEGDDLDIYLVRVGGVCIKKECDWLFLVEEFQKPKNTN